jgi:hypothetical protein
MGIVNRSKDSSEQQYAVDYTAKVTVTGKSDILGHMPHAVEIQSAKCSGVGLSGSPTAQLGIQRFVTGAGATLIPLGPAVTIVAVGTSGPQSFSFSSTAVQSGDKLVVTHAGTNAGLEQLNVCVVVKATQDIKTWSF